MKRTSSEGKALDEHPTKDETNYTHKAKSHVSHVPCTDCMYTCKTIMMACTPVT